MPDTPDTTTFVPELVDEDFDAERDPTGAIPGGLPPIKATDVWRCRVCGYSPVDKTAGKCYNCGRDFVGAEQGVPDVADKPARPQVRSDGVT
jgi:hypothetical protein